ncbi:hypothetical protein HG535_0A06570 [Zygotorulaspora mrakii]|uniref:Protein DML1 n=1 Tax=Zygotorulaspora mrakii TaxID=42260 RepID=A0A7H9AWI8_ZYGMR|nr:uncharacterized protein HG535_0A06570 [Zygotorulaspora mrakii]QLG70715.1 hypothetical protein HG535_0A06570 [Zygotorulaspora mrakii]
MHEVITISLGQRANHTATQFFNCQQELLSEQGERLNDPSIFLNPTIDKLSKTVSYAPRSLIWDAKNGTGSLGTYQYSHTRDYYFGQDNESDENHNVIMTHPAIPKSQYQQALDSGSFPLPKLTTENTKYWSDYSKLVYSPRSFNILKDWYHDVCNPNKPDFEKLETKKFDNFDVGYQEFNESYLTDFFDGNFHSELEQCDTLQGFNLIMDMDSGWGGFTTALVQELRNELPKKTFFNWGYNENDPLTAKHTKFQEARFSRSTLPLVENKIKAMAYMSEDCDLMVPLYADSKLSNWEQGGLTCKYIDAISSVLSLSHNADRKSMDFVKDCFTFGDTSKCFVSSFMDENETDDSYFARIMPFRNHPKDSNEQHVFSECSIIRGIVGSDLESSKSKKLLRTYPYHPSDTIPRELSERKSFSLKYKTTEICRNVFTHYHEIVTKYIRNTSDREELKDRLATLASQYEYGWYDDEDSSDDL